MLCNVTPGNWGGADSTSSKPALVMEGATRLFLVHPHLASLCDEEAPVRIINWCTGCTKRENMPLLCKIDKSSSKRSSTTWWRSSSSIRCQTLQVHQIPPDEKLGSRFFGGNAPDPNRWKTWKQIFWRECTRFWWRAPFFGGGASDHVHQRVCRGQDWEELEVILVV